MRARQLELQFHGVEMGPVQHRDLARFHFARIQQPAHLFDHVARLVAAVGQLGQDRLHVRRARRAQDLLVLLGIAGDDLVGHFEDARHAAVVLLQLEDRRVGIAVAEGQDVLHLRAAPRIDALEIVAHRQQVAVARGDQVHEVALQLVRVLVFVHQHVPHALLVAGGDVGVFLQELEAVDEQVVEIHGVQAALALFVERVDLQDAFEIHRVPFEMRAHGRADVRAAVRRQPEDAAQHRRLRELLVLQPQLGDAGLQQPRGIVLVEDGVVRPVAEQGGMAAQHAVGRVVERAAPEPADVAADQVRGALEHLARGAVGEGQQEDVVRVDALFQHQPRHAVRQRPRLARPRRGDDQHRAVRRRHGAQLLRVEVLGGIEGHGTPARPACRRAPPRPCRPASGRRTPARRLFRSWPSFPSAGRRA